MSLKVTVIFCIILALWTSISGELHIVPGDNWRAEMVKCASGGADEHRYTFNIDSQSVGNVPYDYFNENTTVTAGGIFELATGSSDLHTPRELLLEGYVDASIVKIYWTRLHADGGSAWSSQKNHMQLTVGVVQNGSLILEIHVYAGSWVAVTCCTTMAQIDYLKIVV